MKMVKRIAALALAVCMVLCVSACDSEETNSGSSAISQSASDVAESSSYEQTSDISDKAETNSEANKSETVSSEPATSSHTVTTDKDSQNQSDSVTVSDNEETTELVWVPTNGGKKYHTKSSCSNMKNPKQVSKETAIADGFGPCGNCYR